MNLQLCTGEHDDCNKLPWYPFVGQNIYFGDNIGPIGKDFPAQMVTRWYKENNRATQSDINKLRDINGIGHFTQVVWGETTKVGCAVTTWKLSSTMQSFAAVCNYDTGNILKRAVYLASSMPGKRCTTGLNQNYPGLCSETEPDTTDKPEISQNKNADDLLDFGW